MPTKPIPALLLTLAAGGISDVALASSPKSHDPSTLTVTGSPIIEGNQTDNFATLSTWVDKTQVRDLHALDVSSALRRTPGVVVSRFNPVGSFGGAEGGAVYVRGMGASRPGSEIQTYIDEIPFYMPLWGHPLPDLLPLNGMQSIQVYKGPQPQQFGNTFAAINLTPEVAKADDGHRGSLQLSGGSFYTLSEQAVFTGREGKWDYMLSQGYSRSDGARDDGDGRLSNGMGRLGYRINDNWSVSGLALHTDNRASDPGEEGLPATKNGDFLTRATLASFTLSHHHARAQGELRVYYSHGRGAALNQSGIDGDTISDFSTRGLRFTESMQLWPQGDVRFGLDIDESEGDVAFRRVAPAPADYFNTPVLRLVSPHLAISHSLMLNDHWLLTPSIGIRAYDHNVYDSSLAPHAGLVLSTDHIELRANVSRGMHYPGLETSVMSQLIPALGDSWESLEPEELDHREIGLRFTPFSGTTFDLAVFRDNLKNRYLFAFPPAVTRPSYINLGRYHINGAEFSWQQSWSPAFNSFVGITWLDSSLKTLPYAPDYAISAGINYQKGRWHVSADAQYQRDMYVLSQARTASSTNLAKVSSFTVANLRTSYRMPQLGPDGEVFLAIENLFDSDYAYRPGYPMPGTSAQIGVRMGF
ncbi:TonB-dependent receptor [Marinobacterium sp. BA1]|uniref:TonB-dependent receptor n=1 Tax=Marinobacterium sp. BA1 TaxID=3138931 RepID=UPI0032E5BB91